MPMANHLSIVPVSNVSERVNRPLWSKIAVVSLRKMYRAIAAGTKNVAI
jgi:hypothetical protein